MAQDTYAEFDAFVADERFRAGDQPADLILAFAAEGAA
jgi:hypothetical protein